VSGALKGIAAVILSAGKGTRMRSDLVKVLHPLLGVPMLSYTVDLALDGSKPKKPRWLWGIRRIESRTFLKIVPFSLSSRKNNSARVMPCYRPFHFLRV